MINELRKQQIQEKVKQERQIRRQMIQQGQQDCLYIDDTIVQPPNLGSDKKLNQQDTPQDQPSTPVENGLQQRRDKLKTLKSELFKKTECMRKQCQQHKQQYSPQVKKSPPQKDFYQRLAQPKKELQDERELYKQQLENQQILATCTFQPEISQNSELIAQLKYSNYNCDVVQRLAILDQERQQHIEQQKQEVSEKEKQQLQSQKSTYQNFASEEEEPLYKRLAKVMKDKQRKLNELQMKQQEEEKSLYKPHINEQSQVLAEIKNQGQDVVERLTQHGIRKSQRILATQSQEPKYEFQPEVNTSRNLELVKSQQSFYERQVEYQERIQKKYEMMQQCYEIENSCSFKPNINQVSNMIIDLNNEKRSGTIYNRLHDQDLEKRETQKKNRIETEEQKYQFKPSLNDRSLSIAVNRTRNDLIENQYAQQRAEQLKSKYEEERYQECSFYPSLCENDKYNHLNSIYSLRNCSDTIKAQQVEKENRRRQILKEREQEELEKCTFHPHTNKNEIKNEDNRLDVKVKGIEEFMAKVDKKQRMMMEKKKREEQLFEIHKRYQYREHSGQY